MRTGPLSVWLTAAFLLVHTVHAQTKISGFTDPGGVRQLEMEKAFDAGLDAKNHDTWLKFLSSRPHHVGSVQAKANVDYMANLFRQWGYSVDIARYDVLFPTPRTRLLELQGPKPYKAKLEEPVLAEDRTSGQRSEQLPTYNAFSGEGDVTAELVFVNRGIPEDYEVLERMGISVKGKIVIAKYGGSWRGIKPKVAAEHGAVGCLIYSDPEDDGYAAGDVYPKGPFRPARIGDGHARCSRRPAHAGLCFHERCQKTQVAGCAHDHEDTRAAHILRGCTSPPGITGRPRGACSLAGSLADHISRRSIGREGQAQARIQLGYQTRL
jgi:hypothetical protein